MVRFSKTKIIIFLVALFVVIVLLEPIVHIERTRARIRKSGASPCEGGSVRCADLAKAYEDAGRPRTGFDTGQILDKLAEIPNIETLYMEGVPFSSDDLKALKEFNNLTHIEFTYTYVDGRGLAEISKVKTLRALGFTNCRKIDDVALNELAGMTSLENLNLFNVPITDESIRVFELLPSLKYLDVRGTKITHEGIARVRRSKPDLQVLFERVNVTGRGPLKRLASP